MSLRYLSLAPPPEYKLQDDFLLYYYYQKHVRENGVTVQNDPMMSFTPNIAPGVDIEAIDWSLGGFAYTGRREIDAAQTPQPVPTYGLLEEWINDYTRTLIDGRYDAAADNSQFYGWIPQGEAPPLTVNLPRFFERERESTYRKIINNSAVRDFLSTLYILKSDTRRRMGNNYYSLEQVRSQNQILSSADSFITVVLEEADRIRQARRLSEDRKALLGIAALNILGSAIGKDTTLLDLIDHITGVSEGSSEGMGEAKDFHKPRTFSAGIVFKAMEEIMHPDHWVALVANSGVHLDPDVPMPWSYFKTAQHTPFVDTGLTRKSLENTRETTAGVVPKYNLYIPGYEASIASPDLPETFIPNGYAYYLSNGSKSHRLRPPSRVPNHIATSEIGEGEQWPGVSPHLINSQRINHTGRISCATNQDLLTMGDQLSPHLIYKNGDLEANTLSLQKYYREYSKIIGENEDPSGEITADIIFPSTDLALMNTMEDNSRMFPMDIDIKFRKDIFSNTSAQILENNLCSVRILSGISQATSEPQRCSVVSDNLSTLGRGQFVKTRQAPINKSLDFYDIPWALGHNEPISSLVLTDHCLESSKGQPPVGGLGTVMPAMSGLEALAQETMKSYHEILMMPDISAPDQLTHSDAIGYRLIKYKLIPTETNTLQIGPSIQNIYFGVSSHEESQSDAFASYIDTQVKYGENYGYSLYEYRLIYSTEYEFMMVGTNVPSTLRILGHPTPSLKDLDVGHFLTQYSDDNGESLPVISYRCYVIKRPKIQLVEIPIYDRTFYTTGEGETPEWPMLWRSQPGSSLGVAYPPVQVRDSPPPPPDLKVLPLKGNPRQVKLVMSPSIGTYEGKNALPVLYIPHGGTYSGHVDQFWDTYHHQQEYSVPPPENQRLPDGTLVLSMNAKNEGVKEIKAVKVYRTTELDKTANLGTIMRSFDTALHPTTADSLTLVNTLYAPGEGIDPTEGEVPVVAYDMIDTIEPNVYYYYTCVAIDAHNQTSTVSPIYQVRLVFDKGLLIPEVNLYEHKQTSPQTPTRKFARFMQVKSSAIQSNPFAERNDAGEITSIRNLASERGQTSITGNKFIVRLTSKDTGRKFDIELSFNYEDTPISQEEE